MDDDVICLDDVEEERPAFARPSRGRPRNANASTCYVYSSPSSVCSLQKPAGYLLLLSSTLSPGTMLACFGGVSSFKGCAN